MADETLGPLERRVMAALWARGAQSPREVLDELNADAPQPLAYTTVMTVLVRLARKGYVGRERAGRAYRYRPLVDEAEVAHVAGRRVLDGLLQRYGPEAVARFTLDLGPAGDDLANRLRILARRSRRDREG